MGHQNEPLAKPKRRKPSKRKVQWRNSRGTFRISEVDAATFVEYVDTLLEYGCLVSIFSNRDRTNVGLRVKHDDLDDTGSVWPTSSEELVEYLRAVEEALNADRSQP